MVCFWIFEISDMLHVFLCSIWIELECLFARWMNCYLNYLLIGIFFIVADFALVDSGGLNSLLIVINYLLWNFLLFWTAAVFVLVSILFLFLFPYLFCLLFQVILSAMIWLLFFVGVYRYSWNESGIKLCLPIFLFYV